VTTATSAITIPAAVAAASEVAATLASPGAVLPDGYRGDGRRWPQSLAGGAAGIALLHVERARSGHGDWATARGWLTEAASGSITAASNARLFATLAAGAGQGTRQERATSAAGVLNKAALVASDCGVPALARDLCRRQYELVAQLAPLPGWAVRLALQPVLNVPRQLIRDGHGGDAHAVLLALHQAALSRAAAVIDGMRIDFGALSSTADGHKEACTLTWTALLADGTRALAQAGRWRGAAEHAAAYRGTGTRLLDGRQAAILALLADGQPSEAAQMVEQSTVAEPWEHAVQAVFAVLCQRAARQNPVPGTATMLGTAWTLVQARDPATAVTRTRIGLTALALAGHSDTMHAPTSAPR